VLIGSEGIWSVAGGSFAWYAESAQVDLARGGDTHWSRLFFLRVNMIVWMGRSRQLPRGSMRSSGSRAGGGRGSPCGCRTNSHCVFFKYICYS